MDDTSSQRVHPTDDDLAASRDSRVAARRLTVQERYVALLRLARRVRTDSGFSANDISRLIEEGDAELEALRARAGGRIVPRRRPVHGNRVSDETCTVFVDECGQHSLRGKDPFGVFVLAAVVVRDSTYPAIDSRWREWKAANLGAEGKIVHEPDVRIGRGPFWLQGDQRRRSSVIDSLGKLIPQLDFAALACVVHRERYKNSFGLDPIDESLPTHQYLMALDFLVERLVMVLENQFGGARARLIAESRGLKEDAALQYEFARLQLDGTTYVADAWFRHQLAPWIEFQGKKTNCTGLQLTDLLARPCGEKVLDPGSTPPRWPEFRDKLCQGRETAHSILGLKIVPWDDEYAGIWDS